MPRSSVWICVGRGVLPHRVESTDRPLPRSVFTHCSVAGQVAARVAIAEEHHLSGIPYLVSPHVYAKTRREQCGLGCCTTEDRSIGRLDLPRKTTCVPSCTITNLYLSRVPWSRCSCTALGTRLRSRIRVVSRCGPAAVRRCSSAHLAVGCACRC